LFRFLRTDIFKQKASFINLPVVKLIHGTAYLVITY